MRFGLLYEAQRPFKGTSVDWNTLYKETLEQCVLAEKVGFDHSEQPKAEWARVHLQSEARVGCAP